MLRSPQVFIIAVFLRSIVVSIKVKYYNFFTIIFFTCTIISLDFRIKSSIV